MKIDILIVDFALVAAVFVPYFLFILLAKKEERELNHVFSETAKKHQLNFGEKDQWNKNIIGLNKGEGIILFVQKRRLGIITELVALKDVESCEVLQEVQEVKINRTRKNILQRLDLQLKMHNGSLQVVNLYNCDETYSQDYELQHAEWWNRRINELVVFRPTLNSVA